MSQEAKFAIAFAAGVLVGYFLRGALQLPQQSTASSSSSSGSSVNRS